MYLKGFHNLVTLLIIYCAKNEGTFLCGHHKHYHSPVPANKYNFVPKTIITSNPETKIEVDKFLAKNDHRNIPKIFFSFKKGVNSKDISDTEDFQEKRSISHTRKETTTTCLSSTINTSTPRINPQQSINLNMNNQVINGHSYVYNINNYGTHYHSYDSKTIANSTTGINGFISPDVKNANEDHKKNEWVNDVKLS